MSRNIIVVLAPDVGERVRELAFKDPVWLLDTEANRERAHEVWSMAQQWPQVSVTFVQVAVPPGREDWLKLLEQIELHHGAKATRLPFQTVEIIGAELTSVARAAFWQAGFPEVEPTEGGFRGKKPRLETRPT